MTFRTSPSPLAAAPLFFVAVLGCGNSERATVEGSVTLDGQPLKQGSISFTPIGETKGPVAGATIVAGMYHVESAKGAAIGTNRVQIRGVWATGRRTTAGDETIEEYVEMVPAKYHKNSTLERTIEPGTNQIDFKLTTGK